MKNKISGFKPNMSNVSQRWLDILIPFSYEYTKKLNTSEISNKTKIPKRTISRYLIELVKKGILRFEEKGNNKLYYLDGSNERAFIALKLIENYKSFSFSQDNFLWKDLKELVQFGTIVLFGSHVKGYSNTSSDIDVVIFAKRSKKLKTILRKYPRVQAQIILFESFEKLVLKKDVLALEILKNHVIFGNSDEFINLCRRFYGI